MNAVSRFFLRAKHWQIFLLVCGVYFVGQVALINSLSPAPSSQGTLVKGDLRDGFVMALSALGIFVWFWSMGTFFSSITKTELKLKPGFFRFALVYPVFYFIFFIANFQNFKPAFIAVMLPLHLLAMLCMFYILYFVSKSMVLAETGKPAVFYDYAGPFFLLWFFPIGIWIIQPRVNQLYSDRRRVELSPGEAK